jgi:3-(methylsulfanyl)propanoyl-CoA dehydrogenase
MVSVLVVAGWQAAVPRRHRPFIMRHRSAPSSGTFRGIPLGRSRRGVSVYLVSDYSAPLDDMRFVLEHVTDLGGLAQLAGYEHADPQTVAGILAEAARFFEEQFAPLNRVGDVQHSRRNDDGSVTTPEGFGKAYRRYVEAGWPAVPFPEEYGGGGFPWLVGIAMQEMMTAANMAFSLCPLLTQGAIDMLVHYGDEQQRETYLPKMVTGEWTGTMNLTEPQAGSDVGALTTRAVPAGDGTWRISGQKIFITYGEHDLADNIVHLVLARVPDAPPGTKGISCFIVPKVLVEDDGTLGKRNAVECVSIEDKMGINASPTCVMVYEDAVGYLIGEPNQGMRYMFRMMNTARLSVGVEGLAVGDRAYQQAVAYAKERVQGRAVGAASDSGTIIEHADVRRMLLTMKAYLEALRGLLYLNAESIDLAKAHPDEAVRTARGELVDVLTPISKGWGTDLGVELTSLAVQVHGGMGYVEETGVAQHYRDIRIAPIYEGTNGIQAIDLVGRKIGLRDGAVVRELLDTIDRTAEEARATGDVAELGARLAETNAVFRSATEWLIEHGAADPNSALAGAAPYLRMAGLVTGGWLLTRSALAAVELLAEGGDRAGFSDEFLTQKLVTARFYATQLLPQAIGLLQAVTAGDSDLYNAAF